MKYTESELKVIESIGGFLNYGDLESDLDDNATYFTIDEINIEPKKLRGVLSSLERKHLIYKDFVGEPLFIVTYFGIKEYYRIYG